MISRHEMLRTVGMVAVVLFLLFGVFFDGGA